METENAVAIGNSHSFINWSGELVHKNQVRAKWRRNPKTGWFTPSSVDFRPEQGVQESSLGVPIQQQITHLCLKRNEESEY